MSILFQLASASNCFVHVTVGNYSLIVSFFLCKTWHHGTCMGITEEDGEELQDFCFDMCAA